MYNFLLHNISEFGDGDSSVSGNTNWNEMYDWRDPVFLQ